MVKYRICKSTKTPFQTRISRNFLCWKPSSRCVNIFFRITFFSRLFYLWRPYSSTVNWDIVPLIRRQVQPLPRVAISKALTNPSAYLGCNCCSPTSQESAILPTMPDICIAYKLHTECGRLINLYDWMVSFNCVHKKVTSQPIYIYSIIITIAIF